MTRDPEGNLFNIERAVREVVGQHTKEEIEGVYARFKDTLGLVGITPATAPYKTPMGRPYHFIDLPGEFYIGFCAGKDGNDTSLVLRRVQDQATGGYTSEDFFVNPEGNISYQLDERGESFNSSGILESGFLALHTAENPSEVITRVNTLQATLHAAITRPEHQPEIIQQEVRDFFPVVLRTFRRRKIITLPEIGSVKAFLSGTLRTADRQIVLVQQQSADMLEIHEDGHGSIYAGEKGVGHIRYKGEDGFDLLDPHFFLMKVREFRAMLAKAA